MLLITYHVLFIWCNIDTWSTEESQFPEPRFFKPPDHSNQTSLSFSQSSTVVLHPISVTGTHLSRWKFKNSEFNSITNEVDVLVASQQNIPTS